MAADGDELRADVQELLGSIEDEGINAAEVARQLRAILEALPPGSGAVDTPMRRKVAEIADRLEAPPEP